MRILTEDQKNMLIEEARISYAMVNDGPILLLQHLSQICRVEYDMDSIDFYLVIDKQRNTRIRCGVGVNDIYILDSSIEKYGIDGPEDFVRIIDDMFYLLKLHDDNTKTLQ